MRDNMPGAIQLIAYASIIVLVAGFLLYNAARPKPIQGIPCDHASANRLLGDVPDFMEHFAKTTELFTFLERRCHELDSPIIQIFMRPFAKPWVVLADCRESHDIMTQRGREFDRSDFFRKLFAPVFPKNQISMPTNDHWRYNRLLMRELMTPAFLDGVAAPLIHSTTLDLVDTWREKARLAKGHAFDVRKDVQFATLDSICVVSFGSEVGISRSQVDALRKVQQIELPATSEGVAAMPKEPLPEAWYALHDTVTSGEIALSSPLGSFHHWFAVKFYPRLRKSFAFRNRVIQGAMDKAWNKFRDTDASADEVKCAADWIVERQSKLAQKGSKPPDPEILFDELAGLLQAGFDTTSSSIQWGLKYLTGYQHVQQRLRQDLANAFSAAREAGRQPTAAEISKVPLPYLDAFIEESLRYSCIISVNIRVATEDVNLLGYLVPKGTDVYMLTNGPSILKEPIPIDENRRSQTSREYKSSADKWNQQDLHLFRPERWLTEKDGSTKFNSRAAPMQNFGLGLRSCYGKKLAYQNLRIIYALIVWNFMLDPLLASVEDFKATDSLTHLPQNVRLVLRKASW